MLTQSLHLNPDRILVGWLHYNNMFVCTHASQNSVSRLSVLCSFCPTKPAAAVTSLSANSSMFVAAGEVSGKPILWSKSAMNSSLIRVLVMAVALRNVEGSSNCNQALEEAVACQER